MYQTARPVRLPRPDRQAASCPECGIPIEGIESTEPGRHAFAGCGHHASALQFDQLTAD